MARAYLRQAKERIKHAEEAFNDGNFAYVIRQCQESVELALKASLRLVGVEPPKFHDVGPVLKAKKDSFPEWFQSNINKMAFVSRTLGREREASMYGDEELSLPPDELYTDEDAKIALDGCKFVFENCMKLFRDVTDTDI